jgi:2-polyprenyl-3-methyl-5-hydroxy-6-metoxy-1,4-benzoquinol methylase
MPNPPRPASVDLDPERHEIDLLLELAPTLHGARVLEVGCGDGRLTRRYADRASVVLAIDPDPEGIATACRHQTGIDDSHVTFLATPVADLDPRAGPFDVVIMSWSL